jgi:dCTP deaminase
VIKPDSWIRAWAEAGGVDPYEPLQVNAASYDVRVSHHWLCPTRDPEELTAPQIKLFPGEVVLASTLEYVRIPRDVACDLKLKSTLGRLWINHSLAGWCDPGFQGNITLELQNLGPVPFVLEAGRRIAQLIFVAMESPPTVAYGEPGSSSHYQGQRGTTPARGEG